MSFFHNLNKTLDSIAARPESAQLNERDMGKHNNATTGFAALAKKTGGGEKGARIAGAQLAKMRAKGQVNELSPATLKSYDQKATQDVANKIGGMIQGNEQDFKKIADRQRGAERLKTRGVGEEGGMEESAFQAAIGKKKYGDEGMKALQKAGRNHSSDKTMDAIRNKYDKYDESQGMTDEGNAFSKAVVDAKRDGVQPGEKIQVGGKQYPVKETEMTPKQKSFAALAPPADKITFADKIAGAKKEVDEMLGDVAAEAMRSALGGGRGRNAGMDEASDDNAFTAHKRARAETPKVGTITHGSKHDVEEIPGGRRVTRRTDSAGISVGADDGQSSSDAPRGRGRPKGPAKAPERVTGGATKHKDGRKVKEGDMDSSEYDQEGKMAKDDIKTVVRHAQALQRILSDNDNLPEWVQSKLSKIEGMMSSIDNYMQNQDSDGEEEISEKAVSKKQQKFMGMVHAAQKGEKPASGAVAKVAKTMKKSDAEDFATTKHKGLPEKKKPEAKDKKEESVEDKPSKSSSKFKFGGSVYENLDTQLETLINESMNVSVNMATADNGQDDHSITVTASGEDAMALAQLLKSAGLTQSSHEECSTCGQRECGCEQMDENSPNWPTNTETSNNALQYAGGLNKPKSTGQTTTPVIASQLRRQVSMEESVKIERNLFDLYKNFTK